MAPYAQPIEFPRFSAASLALGPLLLAAGDLMHPPESADPMTQAQILAEAGTRWYAAHLLLFLGFIAFVPGVLALTGLTMRRARTAGYVARILMLIGMLAVGTIFVTEMLLGRYVGATDVAATQALLATFFSGPVFGPILPAALAYFAGVWIVMAVSLRDAHLRLPGLLIGLGALLILVEIITSQTLFSKIGNVVFLLGALGYARRIAAQHPAA